MLKLNETEQMDLKRVIWHELGHLCIDILITKIDPEITINNINFKFHPNASSLEKWEGFVECFPNTKYQVLVESIEESIYEIINLISGCVFQTIFFNKILKEQTEFNKCFKGTTGSKDRGYQYLLVGELIKKYDLKNEFAVFIENELSGIYYEVIAKNELFISAINQIVTEKFEEINQSKDAYNYTISDAELHLLIDKVNTAMKSTAFNQQIYDLVEIIKNKLEISRPVNRI